MATRFSSIEHLISLGSLGSVTGLLLAPGSSAAPTCTYIGGLPYALPPTGQYRFRAPRPLPKDHTYGTSAKPGRYVRGTAVCPQPSSGGKEDTSLWSEDCLQLNVWIPSGEAPAGGWPVFFYIHGGFLQWGNANMQPAVIANMLHETTFKAIVVQPAYRLNVFGFLASRELELEAENLGETVGNCGFWDQRIALEWTARNVHVLGGNAKMITVAGYSAGSHSTFQQLAHDLNRPKDQQLIGRIIMWSNGPGVQAKQLPEAQKQYVELLSRLNIDPATSAANQLSKLRAVSAEKLIEVQQSMRISEFRAVSDGQFVNKGTIRSIRDGTFAKRCKERGIRILNGECGEEWNMYAIWRPPQPTYDDFYRRLAADYPERTVKRLLQLYLPDKKLPGIYKDWRDAWGKVYADIQVYTLERGFAHELHSNGFLVGKDLLRYRIEWRPKCVDKFVPPSWGVTHSTDMSIWFWGSGMGDGLSAEEKSIVAPLHRKFADFVSFRNVQWSEEEHGAMLRLDRHGKLMVCHDALWDHGLKVWDAATAEDPAQAKL